MQNAPWFPIVAWLLLVILFPITVNAQTPGRQVHEVPEKNEELSSENKVYLLGQSAFLPGSSGGGRGNWLMGASLHVSGGYIFNHWLQAGLGTGMDQFDRTLVVPVFAELRGTTTDKEFSPYYALKTGWGMAGYNDDFRYQKATGGFMAQGQVGMAFRMKSLKIMLGGGYHWQKVKLEGSSEGGWGWWEPESAVQNRLIRRAVGAISIEYSF